MLYVIYSITEYDIADFLDSMYKEREHYDAYNNRCKSDGACTFFKHVSIHVHKFISTYIFRIQQITHKIKVIFITYNI